MKLTGENLKTVLTTGISVVAFAISIASYRASRTATRVAFTPKILISEPVLGHLPNTNTPAIQYKIRNIGQNRAEHVLISTAFLVDGGQHMVPVATDIPVLDPNDEALSGGTALTFTPALPYQEVMDRKINFELIFEVDSGSDEGGIQHAASCESFFVNNIDQKLQRGPTCLPVTLSELRQGKLWQMKAIEKTIPGWNGPQQ